MPMRLLKECVLMDKHINKWRRPPRDPDDDPYVERKIFIPKGLAERMDAKSKSAEIPLGKLFCYAADNELTECENPFAYNLKCPDLPFKENQFAKEAGLIFDYLKKFPKGTGLDVIMLARHFIGVPERDLILLGYRELLHAGMIEEYYPTEITFRHAKDYKYARIKGYDAKVIYKNRYKKIAGLSTNTSRKAENMRRVAQRRNEMRKKENGSEE